MQKFIVLFQVLDATFDSITPLAVERMPEMMCKIISTILKHTYNY